MYLFELFRLYHFSKTGFQYICRFDAKFYSNVQNARAERVGTVIIRRYIPAVDSNKIGYKYQSEQSYALARLSANSLVSGFYDTVYVYGKLGVPFSIQLVPFNSTHVSVDSLSYSAPQQLIVVAITYPGQQCPRSIRLLKDAHVELL
jgi:hypothetical protein